MPTLFRRHRRIDTEVLAGKKERLPMRMIAFKLLSLIEVLDCIGENIDFEEQSLIESVLRHCRYEKRKRKSVPEIFNDLG